MKHAAKSIRAFIGAINFEESRLFYKELGFEKNTGEENAFCMTPPEYSGILENSGKRSSNRQCDERLDII